MEIILALVIGFGGGWYIAPTQRVECADRALITVACPQLQPLTDATFGGHILQIQQDSGRYLECRRACLSNVPDVR